MSLEKLAKTWILRMTPTALHFIVADQELVDQSHIQVWGQIQAVRSTLLFFFSFLPSTLTPLSSENNKTVKQNSISFRILSSKITALNPTIITKSG